MQSWQQVQVTNAASQHHMRAGYVLRVEKVGEAIGVVVKLDEVADPVNFDGAELRVL